MSKAASKEQRREIAELIKQLDLVEETATIIGFASNNRVFSAKHLTSFEATNAIKHINATIRSQQRKAVKQ